MQQSRKTHRLKNVDELTVNHMISQNNLILDNTHFRQITIP